MADTQSPLLQLVLQAAGNNDTTWGDIANADFVKLENAIANVTNLALSGSTVTLNSDQARSATFLLTGSGQTTFVVPSLNKIWAVINAGTASALFQTTGNATVRVPPNRNCLLISDGTNVRVVGSGAPVGSLTVLATYVVPSDYLLCDGSQYSRTTYPELFAAIGPIWGAGDGSTTFNVPDFKGRTIVGMDNMGGTTAGRVTSDSGVAATAIGAVGGNQETQAHTHGVNDPGHRHQVDKLAGTNGVFGLLDNPNAASSGPFNTLYSTTGITIQSTGVGNAQNMPPFAVAQIAIKAY